jgi:hypothetical protein
MTLTISVSRPPNAGDPEDDNDGLDDPDRLRGALLGVVEATYVDEAEKAGVANWANPPSCDMESEDPVELALESSAARLEAPKKK